MIILRWYVKMKDCEEKVEEKEINWGYWVEHTLIATCVTIFITGVISVI